MAKATSFMDSIVAGAKLTLKDPTINKIAKNAGGGFEMAGRVIGKDRMGIKEAAIKTFATNSDKILDSTGKIMKNAEKANWNYGKIAGSYIGVSAAARVASGGGLYKDKNGNTNIAGVPFI
nr:MAG TPA: hypothetical protein [Caudoviricetes sp.]